MHAAETYNLQSTTLSVVFVFAVDDVQCNRLLVSLWHKAW